MSFLDEDLCHLLFLLPDQQAYVGHLRVLGPFTILLETLPLEHGWSLIGS